MKIRTTLMTRDRGHDLPPGCRVEVSLARPAYRWTCDACGLGRRFYQRASAFDAAWQHVIGDVKCEAVDPGPPSTLEEMGVEKTFGSRS